MPRLVAVQTDQGRVIDLAVAERQRLVRQGATPDAARRLVSALFPPSMAAAIGLGDAFLAAARTAIQDADDDAVKPLGDLRFLPPVDPPVLRDFTAFEQHMRNMSVRLETPMIRQFYEMPLYYKGSPSTLIGSNEEVPWPFYIRHMDFELELGFVVGRRGRNLTPDDALDYLFGVTILNDFSARNVQGAEMASGFGPAKAKDFASALGPWITTRDELDLKNVEMVARVNGEEWTRGSSSTMTWTVGELIAYASLGETIQPGELLGSGTVGFGSGAEHGRKLEPGDVVELEVQGIGVLRNRIGRPGPPGWTPERRPTGDRP